MEFQTVTYTMLRACVCVTDRVLDLFGSGALFSFYYSVFGLRKLKRIRLLFQGKPKHQKLN